MKKIKRILSTLMVVVMILTAAPLSGFAGLELPNWFNIFASAATYSGTCGDNLTWTLDTDTGELIISGQGDMNDYDYRSPWYDYRSSITKVRIESGAANIGDYAFYGCQNLISVTIPTSIINIGYTAFDYCDKLSLVYYLGTTEEWNAINVETRNGDLTEKTDITFVLYEDDIVSHGTCGSDLSWTLHKSGDLEINGVGSMKDFDSSSVTPWYIFKSSIRNLRISEGIEGIGSYAFDGFTNINNISLPSSLEVIDEFAFRDCTGIINVFYEGNLTEYCNTVFIGYAANPIRYTDNFYVDGILIEGELIIPEGVASIRNNAFYYCNKISKVVIPYSVKYIGSNAFEYCTNIEYVEILNGVVRIQDSAFYNCEKLSSVIIPNTITTIGSSTFNGCNELKTVYYDGTPVEWNNISIGDCNDPLTRTSEIIFTTNDGDVFASGDCGDNLTWTLYSNGELIVSGTGKMESYYDYTYAPWNDYRSLIKKLIIREGVTSIGECAFENCVNLGEITIPESVTQIERSAFTDTAYYADYNNWEYIYNESDYSNSMVLYIGNCLITANADEWNILGNYIVRDNTTIIADYAFENCSTLYNISIPDSVLNIGEGAFYNCTNLEYVEFPSNITKIERYTFCGCESLSTFDFSRQLTHIGEGAFSYCGFYSINLPDSLSYIDEVAFSGSKLKTISIPDSISVIEYGVFSYCENLNRINLPETLIKLGADAFTETAYYNDVNNWEDGVLYLDDCLLEVDPSYVGELVVKDGTRIIADEATGGQFGGSSGNKNITSVTLPNGLETIGKSAFCGCSGVSKVSFPCSVKNIFEAAFYRTAIDLFVIPETVEYVAWKTFNASQYKPTNVDFVGSEEAWEIVTANQTVNASSNIYITINYNCEDTFEHNYGNWNVISNSSCIENGVEKRECEYCNKTEERIIESSGHSWNSEYTIDMPATCTSNGYKSIHCSVCNGMKDGQIIPSIDHSFGDWICLKVATCTENGLEKRECVSCGLIEENHIEVSGHNYIDVIIDPTCTSNGYIVHTCSGCGDSYTDSEVITPGHDYYQNVIVPSCTESGYTINTCRYCNDVYVSDVKPATGHDYTTVVINPTCVNEGYTLGACVVCGASSITDKKAALGHEYFEQVTPATCEAEGYTTYTCTRGDHIYIDNRVAAFGHNYEKTVFAPTCIQDGCTFNICIICGRMHKSDVVSAQGHSFGSWRTIIEPSANKEGLEERYCKYCGYTEERLLPMTQRTSYTATFVADGKTVATIEFLKGKTSIEEPPVPNKDRYTGQWESYTLTNADIVINAVYQPVALNNISGVSNNKTAEYNSSTGVATVTLTASSDAKTVITQSKESVPLDIVLVVDQSGSMNSNLGGRYSKKDSLIDSTTEFVNMVYDDAKLNGVDHRVAIVGFGMGSKASGMEYPAYLNTEILTTGGRPLSYQYATKQDYQSALMSVNRNGSLNSNITTAINLIDANGATAADYGLSMASSIFANNPIEENENRQRIVIFISDGEPTHSSAFETDVANAAIQQAFQLKNTHNATIYSVGVMTVAEARSEKLNAFLARVSSDYADAKNIFGNADRVSETYSINVDDTDNLSGMFGEIVTENITQTTDFDNITIIDTVSKYFTLTSQQEKALRYSVINEYGVKNSDIDITRNDDGTISIVIRNIRTKPVEIDGKVKYSVTISYEVSANENAATAGTYPVCTDDSGIIMDGNECYEKTFAVPVIKIGQNRNTVVFKINGEVYEIRSAAPGSEVTAPETDFIGDYEFSGWDVPEEFVSEEVLSEFDSVLIRPEYVIIWNTENGAERVTYSPGDVITVPDVSPKSNGESFRRWNGTVPVLMPAESLEFTAVYGDHVHQYYAQTVKAVTCLEDGLTKYVCEGCNDSYTQSVASPGEHSWKAIANPCNKENSSTAYFECESCGICADKFLNYIVTENEANERGHYSSITYEYDYMDEDGACYQPDGDITIVSPVSDYFDGADEINVYRIDDNGNKVKCDSEYDNGVLTFETDHFSTYVFEPVYSCQSTGEHSDTNEDGYCDRCDGVLKDFIDFIVKEGIDAQIDSDFRLLLGNDVLNYSVEEIAALFEFGNIFVENKETGKIGTGDIVCLTNENGEVCSKLTVVIFGDVNGDGWYDGTDSIIVSCLANGLLTQDSVSEAVYMAADCNHDGVIDSFDVALLEQAGLFLANVDQSKSSDDLATDAAYIEYLDLIDQTPDLDEEIPETEEPEEGIVDVNTPEQGAEAMSVIEMIINFIKSIFEMLLSFIPVPYK